MSKLNKKTIPLDISNKPEYEPKSISDYKGKDYNERIKLMTEDILSSDENLINIFRIEYLVEIKQQFNFIKIDKNNDIIKYLTEIENIISIYLAKKFNINGFFLGDVYFKKLLNFSKNNRGENIYMFFEETFLNKFYTFIKNIDSFNIPNIHTLQGIGPLDNGTLFGYLDKGAISFKFEYETSNEIREYSFNESKVGSAMEKFDEDILDEKIEIKRKDLVNISNTIFKFMGILSDNKNESFIILNTKGLYGDYLDIKFFLRKNKNFVDDNLDNSLYVNYFRNLIKYIGDNKNLGNLSDFNIWFFENIKLSDQDEELYSKIGNNKTFYSLVMQEFDHLIDDMIDNINV